MALINCPECGKEISDKAESCPNCGMPIKIRVSQNSSNNSPRCPRCGSNNITYQREQSGNIGAAQNTVVIKEPRKSRGCLYWLFIGWWLMPMYWLLIGWWWSLLFGGKKRGGINLHADKAINKTIAVCQNCGNSWKV